VKDPKRLPTEYITHLVEVAYRRVREQMRFAGEGFRLMEWEELPLEVRDGVRDGVVAILEDLAEDHP
jgi:hypothetical protein